MEIAEVNQPLKLQNREDGTGVDEILLTSTAIAKPEGIVPPTAVPCFGTETSDFDDVEAAVSAFCSRLPPKVSRRYDVGHRVRASGELPNFIATAPVIPGVETRLQLWVRNNTPRDLQLRLRPKATDLLAIVPGDPQTISVPANSLGKASFSINGNLSLPISEHLVSFHIRQGTRLHRVRALLVRPLEWRIIGPFDNPSGQGLDLQHPPEAEHFPAASYQGKFGRVSWRSHPLVDTYTGFAFVDLQRLYERPHGQVNWAAAYARTEIETSAEGDVVLTVMGDDMVRVLVDGEVVATAGASLPATLNRRVKRLHLTRGRHVVLAKSCQGRNYWEFYVGFRPALGETLTVTGVPFLAAP